MYGARSPLVPIVLAYAGGLSLASFWGPSLWSVLGGSLLFLAASSYSLLRGFSYSYRHLPGLFLILSCSFAGMSSMAIEREYMSRQGRALESGKSARVVQVRAIESLNERASRFRAHLLEEDIPVLLEVEGSEATELLPGDRLFFRGDPMPIPAPKGPAGFDRKGYYADQGIHHRMELSENGYRIIGKGGTWDPRILALRWREVLYRGLRDGTDLEEAELAVASALWLGRKEGLPGELREDYADAGGMHVLAVSGLHVGIVYFMLQLLCSPLKRSSHGERAFPFIVLGALWCYAILTGWSPSVIRAVLMFSLYSIGESLERSPRVGNAIAGSALLVLLFDPGMIRDIGFLLSYSAVVSIVTLYPRIERLWRPRWKLLTWLWTLLSVSFAAQIGVLPIVLGVFGKFPLWFGVSNILLLPLATLVLYSGALVGLSSFFPQGLQWSAHFVGHLLELMNGWVAFVAGWSGSGIRVGPLALSASLLLATAIAFSILGIYKKLPGWSVQLSWSLFLLVLLQKDLERESREVLVQHAGRDPPVTAFRNGEKVLLWSPSSMEPYRKKRLVEHWHGQGAELIWERGSVEDEVQAVGCNGVQVLYWDGPLPSGAFDKERDLLLIGRNARSEGSGEKAVPNAPVRIFLHREDRAGSLPNAIDREELHILPEEGAYIEPLS